MKISCTVYVIYIGGNDVIMTLPWQALVGVSESWHEEVLSEKSLRLEFAYRVTCAPSFYGSDCNKECVGRDDSNGHYTCNTQGEFVCLPGWTGSPYCTEGVSSYCDAILYTCTDAGV